nr:hypothetical protein [Tanacetum cinerariifolium]
TPTTTAESAPRLSASAKGKRPLRATTTIEQTDLQRTKAEQLKIALKRSRQETHISQQQSGSGTGEGTDSEETVKSGAGKDSDEDDDENDDDNDEDEETAKDDKETNETEEDAEELYRDVNINQGRGLQITQSVEDTHVILTLVNPDDPQESSSMSSFVSSMLNPLSDEGYMDQQMKEAVREVVQKQTDQLQDTLQRENDEFLRNIDDNMKNVLKGLVKT